jgi:hypothetical protein
MEDKDKKFKPFNCWPERDYPDWPLKGYAQPADRDEILVPHGGHNNLNDDFEDSTLECYNAMQEFLKEKFPGWEVDGCDLEQMYLSKEMPDDPRADDDGLVQATFECGAVGFHFAVRETSSCRVFESSDDLDLEWLEIKSFLVNKYQDDLLEFRWEEDADGKDHVSCASYTTKESSFIVHRDKFGNPSLIDEDTKEVFTIKIV